MLKVTSRELVDIISEGNDNFKIITNGLPEEDQHLYREDDGREFHIVEFVDNTTGEEYYFQYIWHPEHDTDFRYDFLVKPDNIEIVPVSVINPPVPVVPKEPELTEEQKADKELWQLYLDTPDKKPFVSLKDSGISKTIIDDIVKTLSSPFNMIQLRAAVIPICIEYGIEQKSFWNFIQKKLSKNRK
ncbi:MAG: hypothetical protein [Caudoviricetes sp.]|nr:MAG: hypothetical protein [Caudoviricetes sp.]